MRKYKIFQCPYEDISCDKLCTLTLITTCECKHCEHYNNGVRFSKGIWLPKWIKNIFKLK